VRRSLSRASRAASRSSLRVAQRLLGGGDGLLGLPDAAVFGDPGVVQPRSRVRFVVVATPGGLEVGGDSVQAAGQPEPERITLVDEDPASTAARRCG
jgi:hypothetical protein